MEEGANCGNFYFGKIGNGASCLVTYKASFAILVTYMLSYMLLDMYLN